MLLTHKIPSHNGMEMRTISQFQPWFPTNHCPLCHLENINNVGGILRR